MYDYSSSIRQIVGLRWAKEQPNGPFNQPTACTAELGPSGKPKRRAAQRLPVGSKGAGLRYERVVASAISALLPQTRRGVWHQFGDANGLGWCQPDLISVVFAPAEGGAAQDNGTTPKHSSLVQTIEIVWECKLTYNPAALAQLTGLYLPIRRQVQPLPIPIIGVVVCRSVSGLTEQSRLVYSIAEALGVARNGLIPVLLWLGRGKFPLQ